MRLRRIRKNRSPGCALDGVSCRNNLMSRCSTRYSIEKTFHDKRLESKRSCSTLRYFSDVFYAELSAAGIGVHHAGMTLDDRRTTEELYLNKVLLVVVATSVSTCPLVALHATLTSSSFVDSRRRREPASVNCLSMKIILISCCAAAHTVVIKGVKQFLGSTIQEYSDLDIMQMMGRAVSSYVYPCSNS